MKSIKKKKAAVFYVDILGMGALTKQELSLNESDFDVWLNENSHEFNYQYLAAAILAEFRKILTSLIPKYKNIVVSQLSDCAFVWSEDVCNVVKFAAEFMQIAVKKGVFCRGGLTYGEIIETNKNHPLGRFIVGPAVTTAVKLEKIAKGARILIDEDFPKIIFEHDKSFSEKTQPLFSPFTNLLDYEVYDEFKWYLAPYEKIGKVNIRLLDFGDKVKFTKNRLKLASQVRLSPRFLWNTRSKQGCVQLKATISFMAENNIFQIHHDFEWTDFGLNRSNEIVSGFEKQLDDDSNYRDQKELSNEPKERLF